MEKKDSSANNSLMPSSRNDIARRSDSLVTRGLHDLHAAEQAAIRERMNNRTVWFQRGVDGTAPEDGDDPRLPNRYFWRGGDRFTFFGMGIDGEDGKCGFFLIGNDDKAFWNEIGDPARLTQERLKSALLKYSSRLHPEEKMPGGGPADLDWEDFVSTHPDDFIRTPEAREAWEQATGRMWGGPLVPPKDRQG
jgi:hypothetical protein